MFGLGSEIGVIARQSRDEDQLRRTGSQCSVGDGGVIV